MSEGQREKEKEKETFIEKVETHIESEGLCIL